MNQIKVNSFHISCYGDSSVGIPDAYWTLSEEFYFDDESDLKAFKDKLKEAFSYTADESCLAIQTDQEVQELVSKHYAEALEDLLAEWRKYYDGELTQAPIEATRAIVPKVDLQALKETAFMKAMDKFDDEAQS